MNDFNDDRAPELRELFFESAQELLQSLNEAGLELEARPGDKEIVRNVRRTVHTLKGDSAACGYQELSNLAHEMEDALAPQTAKAASASLVEVIFTAADTFQAMLAAYRKGMKPPSGEALRDHIRRIADKPGAPQPVQPAAAQEFLPRFAWNEKQQKRIAKAIGKGATVFHIGLQIEPASGMRSAGFELVRKVLEGAGKVLAIFPASAASAEKSPHIEAALASAEAKESIAKKCQIPAVVTGLVIEKVAPLAEPPVDLLRTLLDAESHTPNAPAANFAEKPPLASRSKKIAKPIPAAVPEPEPTSDAPQRNEETPQQGRASAALAAAENTLRVEAARIDAVLNLIGELIIGKSMLHRTILEFDKRFAKDPLRARFADALAFQSRVLDELQRSVMQIRMVPVEQLFRRFPRMVRDVAKNCGKEAVLEIAGENTDLDKGILDALAEPLAHLVRNAVDHGLESPDERAAAGKPRRGIVRLDARHQGNQVVIEISDDGRGIDRNKLKQRAVDRGVLGAAEAGKLTEAEAARLVFEPGVSTADNVTQISGRGVGMDVVAGVIERMKGGVEIESTPGVGTKFRLMMPLTLASIQALLFQTAGRLYAVPLANVVEIARVTDADIHRVDKHDVIRLREQLLTLVHLDRRELQSAGAASRKTFVVVIAVNERKFGLVVDSLMGEEELVIKALDDRLAASNLVSGASILGDGTVVLILNIAAVAARLARIPALGAIA